jgi:hypothetical protein
MFNPNKILNILHIKVLCKKKTKTGEKSFFIVKKQIEKVIHGLFIKDT